MKREEDREEDHQGKGLRKSEHMSGKKQKQKRKWDKAGVPKSNSKRRKGRGRSGVVGAEAAAWRTEAAEMTRARRKRDSVRAGVIAMTGVLRKYKKGFGFLEVTEERERYFADGDDRDVFIAASDINGAMDGDTVEAVLLPQYLWRGNRPEARITKVKVRSMTEAVGVFHRREGFGFVVPEGPKKSEEIFVFQSNAGGAEDGDFVVCRIIGYPTGKRGAEGRVEEIIARRGEPGADIRMLVRAYGYTEAFPPTVMRQAVRIEEEGVRVEASRRDLRNRTVMTIDGRDSKDFDDAVSIEIRENGNYRLGVHIADVSEYVTEDSALDQEAMQRGTSIYLINQVVPMLPEQLSNNICSLRPKEDRLTVSVDMEITEQGEIVNYEIYESVICSSERMVYDDVSDMIEKKDAKLIQRYRQIYPDIMQMAKLAEILSERRKERGSLDFDFDEASIRLDDSGNPVSVEIAPRRTANRMIEEFMLAANETVAKHFAFLQVPFLYRVHEKPDTAKLEELRIFLRGFGILLNGNADSIHPKVLANILEEIKGTSYENVVSTVLLRSMRKAVYDTECLGHFGLSLKYYCHFTSPIRRYPDLMIHRIIKETLRTFPEKARIQKLTQKTEKAAALSSENERKAVELERDVEKLKKAEYLSHHIGEEFDGIISGVTGYGIYVQLENTIEGMVRIETLHDDYYDYEPEKYRLIGRGSGNCYTLGDQVRIRVTDVRSEVREVDFALLSGKTRALREKPNNKSRKRK